MIPSNQTFIIAAYAVTWAVMLAYLFRLVRKGARAAADYERLVPQHGPEHRS